MTQILLSISTIINLILVAYLVVAEENLKKTLRADLKDSMKSLEKSIGLTRDIGRYNITAVLEELRALRTQTDTQQTSDVSVIPTDLDICLQLSKQDLQELESTSDSYTLTVTRTNNKK